MIKNTFTINASDDGTIVLSDTPVFNKNESGVTKLEFTLPEMDGFAYLLARHDRKEWYAIPIIDNIILMGQTVTRFHGRWAFNVCITKTELKSLDRQDDMIYMSDVFEGLVYDNVSEFNTPSAVEPNTLKLANDCRFLYELFAARQDQIEADLATAATAVSNLEAAVGRATAQANKSETKASEAEESAIKAADSELRVEAITEAAAEHERNAHQWARDAFISSQKCEEVRESLVEYAEEAKESALSAASSAENAATSAEIALRASGANEISYSEDSHEIAIYHEGTKLDSINLNPVRTVEPYSNRLVTSDAVAKELEIRVKKSEIERVAVTGLYEDLHDKPPIYTADALPEPGESMLGKIYLVDGDLYKCTYGDYIAYYRCVCDGPMGFCYVTDISNPYAVIASPAYISTSGIPVSKTSEFDEECVVANYYRHAGYFDFDIVYRDSGYTATTKDAVKVMIENDDRYAWVKIGDNDGANEIRYDEDERRISILRDGELLDSVIIPSGGSDVEVTAIETSGKHIADITVDGSKTELYAPNGGSYNPNLLDNPFFLINSRGQSSYTTGGYTVDRWKTNFTGASYLVHINEDGSLVCDNSAKTSRGVLWQFIEKAKQYVGKTVTVSALAKLNSGSYFGLHYGIANAATITQAKTFTNTDYEIVSYTFTVPDTVTDYLTIGVHASNGAVFEIKAIKFEIGSTSTLANEVPLEYEEERIKCVTSKADSSDTYANKSLIDDKAETSVVGGDEWTSGKTYSDGDLVIYNNQLWKCLITNSAVPSEGANWSLTSIAKEIPIFTIRGSVLTITSRG